MTSLQINLPTQIDLFLSSFSLEERNDFIINAIKIKMNEKQKNSLKELLEEGYKASAAESLAITNDFSDVDFENYETY